MFQSSTQPTVAYRQPTVDKTEDATPAVESKASVTVTEINGQTALLSRSTESADEIAQRYMQTDISEMSLKFIDSSNAGEVREQRAESEPVARANKSSDPAAAASSWSFATPSTRNRVGYQLIASQPPAMPVKETLI